MSAPMMPNPARRVVDHLEFKDAENWADEIPTRSSLIAAQLCLQQVAEYIAASVGDDSTTEHRAVSAMNCAQYAYDFACLASDHLDAAFPPVGF